MKAGLVADFHPGSPPAGRQRLRTQYRGLEFSSDDPRIRSGQRILAGPAVGECLSGRCRLIVQQANLGDHLLLQLGTCFGSSAGTGCGVAFLVEVGRGRDERFAAGGLVRVALGPADIPFVAI